MDISDVDFGSLDARVDESLGRALVELAALVAIPSVAAKPDSSMGECAGAVAELLRARGFSVEILPTDGGPPVVFGANLSAGPGAPTVLFYNHYDVQPAEPFDLWTSDPWILRVENDIAYARGVTDDKGHIVCRLMALDGLADEFGGQLPVNVKFVIEGEEEVASVHLTPWIEKHAARLWADVCVWEFGGVDDTGHPEIICGLRGIAYFELRAKTIAYDAHSGVGGSLFPNAAWRLTWALATLKDANERIQLPGHYDSVKAATESDLELLARLPSTEGYFKNEFGLSAFLGGATGVEYQRRAVFEPTCTICGLDSGYQGAGAKTVLPSSAVAKVDFRLVPDQNPLDVKESLRDHLRANGFDDIEIRYLGGMRPGRVDPNHPMVKLAIETAREVYGIEPSVYPLVGGSGPIHPFVATLGMPVVTCGCGYPGGRAHAPDENLRLNDLVLGARHTARFLVEVARAAQLAAKASGEC